MQCISTQTTLCHFFSVPETLSSVTTAILYRPKSRSYPCDAIIIPPINDPGAPLLLLEYSVTVPTNHGRLNKVLAWFKKTPKQRTSKTARKLMDPAEAKRAPEEFGDFINRVKAAYPKRNVIAVLCWPGRFEGNNRLDGDSDARSGGSKQAKKQRLLAAASQAEVSLCVLDSTGLEQLVVLL